MSNFKFSDFDIKPQVNSFVGDKVQIQKLFNLQIKVLDYRIENSKHKAGTKCLHIQIEKEGVKRVVFTGSNVLIGQIERVSKDRFPFTTVIKGDNDYFEFT